MPMVDYLCETCGTRFEHFFHSDIPEAQICESDTCANIAWRVYSMPGEFRPLNASRFDPIVVWVNNENPDIVSVPGRSNEPVQSGYHAVHITDMRMADKMAAHINNISLRDAINQRAMEKEYWNEKTKDRRDSIRARIGGDQRRQALFAKVCEFVDRKRDRRYSKPLDPKGHFQALSFNSSNRQGYSDRDTGWKERRS